MVPAKTKHLDWTSCWVQKDCSPHSWKGMQHPSLQLHTLMMWTLGEHTLLQAHSHAYGPHILLGLIGWIQILDNSERTEIKAFSYTQTTWV